MKFKPLESNENRPVTWSYGLDRIKGNTAMTNSVTIFSRPYLALDESGENGMEKFAVVTLTRAEIADILKTLEEDIELLRLYNEEQKYILE